MIRPLPPWERSSLSRSYPPLLQQFIAKLDPALDAFPSEQYAQDIQKILDGWSAALCLNVHDQAAIHQRLSDRFSSSSLSPSQSLPLRTTGPLRIERRIFKGAEAGNRDAFLVEWTRYLSAWAALETVELQIHGIRVSSESPLVVETDLRFDLVGTSPDGWREQRVGEWHLSWVQDGQQFWAVRKWIADAEIQSQLKGPGFAEITGLCLCADAPGTAQFLPGIDQWRTVLDGASGNRCLWQPRHCSWRCRRQRLR